VIETKTTWEDSGYDCDHCGGQIYKRTDIETGQPPVVCYQCCKCGCQWTLPGDVLRVGNLPTCVGAQRRRQKEQDRPDWQAVWSRRLVIGLLVLGLFVMVRYGGLLAVRFLLPFIFGGFVVWSIVRWVQQQRD